jgi:type 2 lantibiotic biosynthesis protein LanM
VFVHANFQDASWHRAVTLRERIATRDQLCGSPRRDDENPDATARRLRRWRSQSPFNDASIFAQRLAADGITEEEFLGLLGESPLRLCLGSMPAWAKELSNALDGHPASKAALLNGELSKQPAASFLNLIEPLLDRGLVRFREQAEDLIRQFPDAPLSSATLEAIFLSALPKRLLAMLKRTLVLELNVARLEGVLDGATSEDRFRNFTERLRRPEIRLAILREYPVLARQLADHIDRSSAFLLEFLGRLCADWDEIRHTFNPDRDPRVLVHVDAEAGDRHRNGRSVVVCEFSSGFRLVYKPKCMAADNHFHELVKWFNHLGLSPALPTLQILDRGTHGWIEFVAAKSCNSEAELSRFYERQGAWLALLYVLAATDLHCENLIAVGENPILVDVEAIFQPDAPKSSGEDETRHLIQATVQRVGLLPLRFGANAESDGVDFTGLGGAAGQATPYRVPGWERTDTDEMRFVRKPTTTSSAQNRPSLNGCDVRACDHVEEITVGFSHAYRLILKHRDELLSPGGPLSWFSDDEVRVILRPTSTYYVLLSESFHPDVLRDALDREQLLDRLWVATEILPHLAKVISAERQDLQNVDIPIFTTRPSGRDLWTSSGQLIPDFFEESALALVRRRLQNLSERDVDLQLWFIQASLATSTEYRNIERESSPITIASQKAISHERLLSAARSLGDRLESVTIHSGQDISWVGLTPGSEPTWSISPLMLDLYGGLPGVTLFLAYLGAITGERRFTVLAQQACETILRRLEKNEASVKSIGAFSGWGGMIYALSHLGALWHETELLGKAEAIVATLRSLIEQDEHLDIITGAAGCIGALLSLNDQLPSKLTLDAALQCGERLIARAQPMENDVGWLIPGQSRPLAGFAHGAAGIAWALLRLAAVTQDERFRTTALAGIAYERSLFSAEAGNWRDLRLRTESSSATNGEGDHFMTAWCSGAPGIGLARLSTLEQLDEVATHGEIGSALKATLNHGFGQNHCLCHGDLGNIEVLSQAGRILNESQLSAEVCSVASAVVKRIAENKVLCGTPMSVATPGLMTGLAGIGYGLLRLAEPQRVPCVLTLEPPLRN